MAEAIDIRELNVRIEQQSAFVTNLVHGMDQVIVGQKHLVDSLLISLLSDGHILLEGVRVWQRRWPSRRWLSSSIPTTVEYSLLPTFFLPT